MLKLYILINHKIIHQINNNNFHKHYKTLCNLIKKIKKIQNQLLKNKILYHNLKIKNNKNFNKLNQILNKMQIK